MPIKKELKWRVVYGYDKGQYIRIGKDDLPRAKYAMATGKIFNQNGISLRGDQIKWIEQDIRYYTGWNDSYSPQDEEDHLHIKRYVPLEKLRLTEEAADMRVREVMQGGSIKELQEPLEVNLLENHEQKPLKTEQLTESKRINK